MPHAPTKVLCAMSGGVDSSVAAVLLQEAGHEVVGCFMRLGNPDETLDALPRSNGRPKPARGCCSMGDATDARHVAAMLGIPFYVCSFRAEFARVIEHFVAEHHSGRTPNPCVRCNDWLKFGRLHEYARAMGATHVATGHYARIDRRNDRPRLRRGLDGAKDQSYVLFGIGPRRLESTLLPVGDLSKAEVRAIAEDRGLPVHDKPDSQDICFVPDGDHVGLLDRLAPGAVRSGAILDDGGRVLGEHPGHQHFTVGQRRGIRVPAPHPLYVLERDPEANTITVGPRESLGVCSLRASGSTWLSPGRDRGWWPCEVQVRAHAAPEPGRVRALDGDGLEVRLDEPLPGAAPGQAVVCYDDDAVLCGGWIEETSQSA